jgi:hypothetical protein
LSVQPIEPRAKGALPSFIKVFPNVDHFSNIYVTSLQPRPACRP